MLAHIELRLELVVLQVVVLQLRLPPLHGQNIIGEIRVVNSAVVGQVLHQIPQALPDVLKLVEPGVVQVVSMQDLLNQFRLYSEDVYKRQLFYSFAVPGRVFAHPPG